MTEWFGSNKEASMLLHMCLSMIVSLTSSSSLFPAISLGFTIFWGRFLCMWRFFNPSIQVVTVRLRGWCMLGVFSVTDIHPSRSWISGSWVHAMECMCAQTRPQFILSSKRVFREWSQNPCWLQAKNSLYQRLRGGSNPQHCITQDSEPNTLPTELFRPREPEC